MAGPRKRVLLAWEYGTGRTHFLDLLYAARHLRASGVECLACLHNTAASREFARYGIHTLANFTWPGQRRDHGNWPTRPMRSYPDLLANIGMRDPEIVAAAIAHYDALAQLYSPDLILTQQAFGAVLAFRERLPVVILGTSMTVPPVVDGGFPLLAEYDGPSWPVDELLAAINQGLAMAGRFPLDSIGAMHDVAAVLPTGPSQFDIYAARRSAPVLAPNVPGLLRALPQGPGAEIFVYLHGWVQSRPEVMAALEALPGPARAYLPTMSRASKDRLIAAGLIVEDEAVPLPDILRRSRAVVHHGGPYLTAAILAAGLPQLLLTKESDNRYNGRYVTGHGLGVAMETDGASAAAIADAVERLLKDEDMSATCRALAPAFRTWFESEPSVTVAQAVCDLLGVELRMAPPPD